MIEEGSMVDIVLKWKFLCRKFTTHCFKTLIKKLRVLYEEVLDIYDFKGFEPIKRGALGSSCTSESCSFYTITDFLKNV